MAILAAMALPAAASAFQTVTFEQSGDSRDSVYLVIHGDQGKDADLITVTYSQGTGPGGTDELILTHDIVNPLPAGCYSVGSGPPFKEVHCPEYNVSRVFIYAGNGNDRVATHFSTADKIPVSADLGPGNDSFQGSEEDDAVTDDPTDGGDDQVTVGNGNNSVDVGNGSNKVIAGDGANQVTAGNSNNLITVGSGNNEIKLGNGNDKVYAGTGMNRATFGNGNSKFTIGVDTHRSGGTGRGLAAGVTNVVKFGNGNDTMVGGAGVDVAKFGTGFNVFQGLGGNDSATFGGGADKFEGGAGNDTAKLGGGNDTGYGGAGNDTLFGGAGNDHLLGGGGFDLLKGGAGNSDHCNAGPGGGKTAGCEHS